MEEIYLNPDDFEETPYIIEIQIFYEKVVLVYSATDKSWSVLKLI